MHKNFIFRSFRKVAGIEYRPDNVNIYVKWGDVDADLLKAFGEHKIEHVDLNNTTMMGGVAFRMSVEQPPEKKSGHLSTGIPTFKFHLDELVDRAKHKTKLVQMRVKDGSPNWTNLPEEMDVEMKKEPIEN